MLGGGNPVGGNNPAGIGTTVNYLGKHVYGYSGVIRANSSEAIALKFKTGSLYIRGLVSVAVDEDNLGTNYLKFQILMDDQIIVNSRERRDLGAIKNYPLDIIIPPYTNTIIKFPANSTNADLSCVFTGRVYS